MSDSTSLTVPGAGWYPDRSDPRVTRWWDGQQWTDHTRELASEHAASVVEPVSAAAFGLGVAEVPTVAVAHSVTVVPTDVAVAAPAPADAPVAGWYPDNADPLLQRWWDGRQWTEHTAPRVAAAAPAAAASSAQAPSVAYAPNPTYTYADPGVAPAANAIATRGMIFSLIGILINPLLAMSILGIVMGIIGLRRAPRFTPAYARRGRAIAAIAVGIGWIVISVASAVYVYNLQHRGF